MIRLFDEVVGEIVWFESKEQAKKVATQRLNQYKSGYSIRRNYVRPMSVELVEDESGYRIK